MYTALMVPVKVGLSEEDTTSSIIIDTCIDCFFITDIVIQFFAAFERLDGLLEIRHKEIAIAYFKGWFWIDLASSIPTQLISVGSDNNQSSGENTVKLLRILRLAKLQRMIRLLRFLKFFKLLRQI